MNNLYLFQPQYTVKFANDEQYWIPYTAGCLWAYAKQFPSVSENWQLKELFFKREPVKTVLDRIQNPAVCAFSCYVWNEKYCLAVAKQIKTQWPECIIVFGGPQVSGDYTQYDFVDTIVLKEGENCFVEILNTVAAGRKPELFYQLPRIDDLATVPGPYASGVFDDIVRQNPSAKWSVIVETNRGCPYSCTFCDWGGLTESKVKKFELDRLDRDLEWMKDKKVVTMFIADANFGIFKERDAEIARKIAKFVSESSLEFINLNYAKNSNKDIFEIANLLGQVNKGITFSVQSMNPGTLEVIKRKNMKTNDIGELLQLSSQYKISTYTELILGLPLETLDSWKQGINDILELGQHHRLEPQLAVILRNTEMYNVQKQLYKLDTVPVNDFVTFGEDKETGIAETFNVVRSTSTMTQSDMIEAYMYVWTVIHLHYQGYTQLLAKYCRFMHNISYRQFYDIVFEKIQTTPGKLRDEFVRIQTALTNLYNHGDTFDEEIRPNSILFVSLYNFYHNIETAVNLGEAAARELCSVDHAMVELQRRYVQNNVWTSPFTVKSQVDIENWRYQDTSYRVTNQADYFEDTFLNFFLNHRRHGTLKANIEKISALEPVALETSLQVLDSESV